MTTMAFSTPFAQQTQTCSLFHRRSTITGISTRSFVHSIPSLKQTTKNQTVTPASVSKDAVGSWMDLSSFVATGKQGRSPYDNLSDKIGRDCYIDIAGWHLYLKDVKVEGGVTLAQLLANFVGPKLGGGKNLNQTDVSGVLEKIPIKLGKKETISLLRAMPDSCVSDMVRLCEDFARDL